MFDARIQACFRDCIDLAENLLLERHAFEHGLDDDVGLIETVIAELRRDQGHARVHHRLRETAFLHGVRIILADDPDAPIQRLLRSLLDDHRNARVGIIHRNTAAHGPRADHRRAPDLVRRGSLGNVGDLVHRALAKERVNQRLGLNRIEALVEQLRFQLAAVFKGKSDGPFHGFDRS